MIFIPFSENILMDMYNHAKRMDGNGFAFWTLVTNNSIYDRQFIISLIRKKIKKSKLNTADNTNFRNDLKYVEQHPERKFFYINVRYVASPIKFEDVLSIQKKYNEYHCSISKKESSPEHILDLLNWHDYSVHDSNTIFLKCLYDNHIITNSKMSAILHIKIANFKSNYNEPKNKIKTLNKSLNYVTTHPERKYLCTNIRYIDKPINLFKVKKVQQEYQMLEHFTKSSIGY